MSLLSDLAASLAPTVATLAGGFGATVRVYRPTVTTNAEGRDVRTYVLNDTTIGDHACFLLGASYAEQVAAASVARPNGVVQAAAASINMPRLPGTGVLPVINAFDGIKIMDGAYAGWTFLADADGVPDLVGLFTQVKLVSAPAGVLP